MSYMFFEAVVFNGVISEWNTSSVTNVNSMFHNATDFKTPINTFTTTSGDKYWDVSNVTDMGSMFNAISFNNSIHDWDVSNVTNMGAMFNYNHAFNQDISNWDVSNVTNVSNMFFEATTFNKIIRNWTINSETVLTEMFGNATGTATPIENIYSNKNGIDNNPLISSDGTPSAYFFNTFIATDDNIGQAVNALCVAYPVDEAQLEIIADGANCLVNDIKK